MVGDGVESLCCFSPDDRRIAIVGPGSRRGGRRGHVVLVRELFRAMCGLFAPARATQDDLEPVVGRRLQTSLRFRWRAGAHRASWFFAIVVLMSASRASAAINVLRRVRL